jgi:hypothetical protein
MIRTNVPIQVLKLNPKRWMDKDSCRQIFESLPHNSNLRRLEVRVVEVYDDVLILPPHKTSSLQHLRIDVERYTTAGKALLAGQLRTNTVLEEMFVVHTTLVLGRSRAQHRPWIELLQSYNFTLRSLDDRNEARWWDARTLRHYVAAHLRRNERINPGRARSASRLSRGHDRSLASCPAHGTDPPHAYLQVRAVGQRGRAVRPPRRAAAGQPQEEPPYAFGLAPEIRPRRKASQVAELARVAASSERVAVSCASSLAVEWQCPTIFSSFSIYNAADPARTVHDKCYLFA